MYFSSRKFKPHPLLEHTVKCFWVLEAEANAHNSMPVLPDTNIELIITCGTPFVVRNSDGSLVELPAVYLTKLSNRPQYPQVAGDCQFMAVRLYPWAVRSLIDLPANTPELSYFPLNNRWQDFAKTVNRRLHHQGDVEAIYILQKFVIQNCQQQQEIQRRTQVIYGLDPQMIKILQRDLMLEGFDITQALSRITCPTLILRGDWNQGGAMRDEDADYAKAHLQNIKIIQIPGASHDLNETYATLVLEHMATFLQTINRQQVHGNPIAE